MDFTKPVKLRVCPTCQRHDTFQLKKSVGTDERFFFVFCKHCQKNILLYDSQEGIYIEIEDDNAMI